MIADRGRLVVIFLQERHVDSMQKALSPVCVCMCMLHSAGWHALASISALVWSWHHTHAEQGMAWLHRCKLSLVYIMFCYTRQMVG